MHTIQKDNDTERCDPMDRRNTEPEIFILGKGLPVERVPIGLLTKDIALAYLGGLFEREYPDDISHIRLESGEALENYYATRVDPRTSIHNYRMEMCPHHVSLLTGRKSSKERAKWKSRIKAYDGFAATKYQTFAQLVDGYVKLRNFSLWIAQNRMNIAGQRRTGLLRDYVDRVQLLGLSDEESGAIQSIERLVEQLINKLDYERH